MTLFDTDPALIAVIEAVRTVHTPIQRAINDGTPVTGLDCAVLAGSVQHLLTAIDARRPDPGQPAALKAVA
ncbi:hypothetical protein [Streptomyces sp. NPDC059786]|uniref:hypothetical protein n=1 Tax=Streptomyces sp. NPDC059786 TaxID=3346946 RepID=UPI0036690402